MISLYMELREDKERNVAGNLLVKKHNPTVKERLAMAFVLDAIQKATETMVKTDSWDETVHSGLTP